MLNLRRLWGEDPSKVEAVIRDDPEALVMFREAMLGKEGGDKRSQDVTTGDIVTSGGSCLPTSFRSVTPA